MKEIRLLTKMYFDAEMRKLLKLGICEKVLANQFAEIVRGMKKTERPQLVFSDEVKKKPADMLMRSKFKKHNDERGLSVLVGLFLCCSLLDEYPLTK